MQIVVHLRSPSREVEGEHGTDATKVTAMPVQVEVGAAHAFLARGSCPRRCGRNCGLGSGTARMTQFGDANGGDVTPLGWTGSRSGSRGRGPSAVARRGTGPGRGRTRRWQRGAGAPRRRTSGVPGCLDVGDRTTLAAAAPAGAPALPRLLETEVFAETITSRAPQRPPGIRRRTLRLRGCRRRRGQRAWRPVRRPSRRGGRVQRIS